MFTQITWIRTGKVTFIAFLFAQIELKSHLFHLFDFSPLYDFKCLLKYLESEQAKSHWLHFLLFSTVYFQMSPQIYLIFPQCVISNIYSNNLNQNRQSRIDCIFVCTNRAKVTFVAFIWLFATVWFQMFSQILNQNMQSRIDCNFLHE